MLTHIFFILLEPSDLRRMAQGQLILTFARSFRDIRSFENRTYYDCHVLNLASLFLRFTLLILFQNM